MGRHPQNDTSAAPRRASCHGPAAVAMEEHAAPPAATPSIEEQARVATVLYDMHIRGGTLDDATAAQLSAAYPASATLARHCAWRGRQAVLAERAAPPPRQPHRPRTSSRSHRVSVVRRIDIFSFARMCGWLGFVLALSKVAFAALLAFSTTFAREAHPEFAKQIVDAAEAIVGTGRGLQLYRTLLEFVEIQFGSSNTPVASITGAANGVYLAACFPVGVALLATVTGAAIGYSINVALILCGGFRFEHRRE